MLIFATIGISITAIAAWSAIHAQNGFAEIPKLLRGEPAFVVVEKESEFDKAAKGEGGVLTGDPNDPNLNDKPGGGGGAW